MIDLKNLLQKLNVTKTAAVVVSLILLVSFQNCRQKLGDSLLSQGDSSNTGVIAQRISTSDLNSIEFVGKSASSVTTVLRLNAIDNKFILNSSAQKYCLTTSDAFELSEILKDAEVCETKNTDPNLMCTMIYEYPYATLSFQNKSVKLGESTSGCQRTDLCGSYPDIFKGYFQNLIKTAASRSCN